jgi:hypothetical protein
MYGSEQQYIEHCRQHGYYPVAVEYGQYELYEHQWCNGTDVYGYEPHSYNLL